MSNNGQNNGLSMIFAFFTGFLAGAVISLLYAPSPGKEARKKIRDTSVEAKNRTVELAQQASHSAKENVQNLVEQGRENVQGIVTQGKERLHDAGEQVKDAVETGRRVSSEVRTKIASTLPGIGGTQEADEEASEEA